MNRCLVRLKADTTAAATVLMVLAVSTGFAQGPYERQRVDAAAADRGRALYAKHCINCHGSTAKGTDRGPDLIRSSVVLRDRLGNLIGAAIRPGANHQATLAANEIVDLSHFLHQRVEAIVANRNARGPLPVLTGDPEAGRAYFNGTGRCSTCHSPTGDLAGIATRIADPANLQQRFLFPTLRRGGKQVEATVTVGQQPPVTGTVVRLDDFFVSLRDASGEYHAFNRGPGITVVVSDPLQGHHELLDRYTDADMHNVTAYLARLK
ncbi:MAG TPA: c-type cytochrome [Vicinamibacterales bacterium]|jgi:mono/diheme cytochrome c family protein|nr:c-type cytochrome [Vicinamibacterales bacterium]